MKSLPFILVIFSLFNTVHAENLCDESCELSVTFPQGGSLQAIDALTLTFGTGGELTLGTGGTVNTAIQPSYLDFSSGGTQDLSAGESITFGPAGSLVLGTGGNMDALDYSLTTTGDLTIGAAGENQSIHLSGNLQTSGALSFTSSSLELNSTITAGTQLNLENSTTISGSGSIIVPESAILFVGGVMTAQSNPITLSETNGVIISSGTVQINDPVVPITSGSFQPLTSLDGLNGLAMPTSDGGNCIVASPECVADNGTIYVLSSEGALVKKETSSDTSTAGKSGSVDLLLAGFFILLLLLSGTGKTAKLGGNKNNH